MSLVMNMVKGVVEGVSVRGVWVEGVCGGCWCGV